MFKFTIGLVFGFLLGLAVAQVGFGGLVKALDQQVDYVKIRVEQLTK